jgi:hypothetical protein
LCSTHYKNEECLSFITSPLIATFASFFGLPGQQAAAGFRSSEQPSCKACGEHQPQLAQQQAPTPLCLPSLLPQTYEHKLNTSFRSSTQCNPMSRQRGLYKTHWNQHHCTRGTTKPASQDTCHQQAISRTPRDFDITESNLHQNMNCTAIRSDICPILPQSPHCTQWPAYASNHALRAKPKRIGQTYLKA